MALTNNGVLVTVNNLYVPALYTPTPPVTFPTGDVATWSLTLSVKREDVYLPDEEDTFAAIIADSTIGISKQAEDIVSDQMDIVGKDVTIYTEFYDIGTNIARASSATNELYTDEAAAYLCAVRIFALVEEIPNP